MLVKVDNYLEVYRFNWIAIGENKLTENLIPAKLNVWKYSLCVVTISFPICQGTWHKNLVVQSAYEISSNLPTILSTKLPFYSSHPPKFHAKKETQSPATSKKAPRLPRLPKGAPTKSVSVAAWTWENSDGPSRSLTQEWESIRYIFTHLSFFQGDGALLMLPFFPETCSRDIICGVITRVQTLLLCHALMRPWPNIIFFARYFLYVLRLYFLFLHAYGVSLV